MNIKQELHKRSEDDSTLWKDDSTTEFLPVFKLGLISILPLIFIVRIQE